MPSLNAQLQQLALDTLVAPQRILLGHPPYQELGQLGHRPLWVHPMGLVPFLSDELSMPAAQRIWGHERRCAFPHRP
jgi:hypothetical protein